MLEAILIMSIVYACMLLPLRGKSFEQLSDAQKTRVQNNFKKYLTTKKGKETPNMTVEEYLPILAKQGIVYLIVAIVMIPIYILAVLFLYRNFLGF